MKQVKDFWYSLINYVALVVNLLGVGVGIFLNMTNKDELVDVFGLSYLYIGMGILTIIATTFVYQIIRLKHSKLLGALISNGVFLLAIGMILQLTGDLQSIYFVLWIYLVFVAGIYGPALLGFMLFASVGYYIISEVNPDGSIASASHLSLAACFVVGAISFFFWKMHYLDDNGETKVLQLSAALQREQVKSEALIQSISDGVVVTGNDGVIKLFNPAAQNLTGWPNSEAIGISYKSVLKFLDDKNNPLADEQNPFEMVKQRGTAITQNMLLSTRNDRQLIVSAAVSPIVDEKHNVNGVIGVIRDVSSEKEQEKQRAEFISTASHEMRTPVAAIEGYLALAMNPKVSKVDEKGLSFINKAHESTKQLGKLFQDLLTAAKSEDGRLSNHPEVVNATNFLEKVVEDARFVAEKKSLTLDITYGGKPKTTGYVVPNYYLFVDPARMAEVITNLINNAIKFTSTGGVKVDIRGNLDIVQISVQDTGYGIPEEDIPHLFEKFYRVDNSATRTIGGTGLGLFISRQIVELYKGRIWAESKLKEGSTFLIHLPRLDSVRAETMLAAQAEQDESIATNSIMHTEDKDKAAEPVAESVPEAPVELAVAPDLPDVADDSVKEPITNSLAPTTPEPSLKAKAPKSVILTPPDPQEALKPQAPVIVEPTSVAVLETTAEAKEAKPAETPVAAPTAEPSSDAKEAARAKLQVILDAQRAEEKKAAAKEPKPKVTPKEEPKVEAKVEPPKIEQTPAPVIETPKEDAKVETEVAKPEAEEVQQQKQEVEAEEPEEEVLEVEHTPEVVASPPDTMPEVATAAPTPEVPKPVDEPAVIPAPKVATQQSKPATIQSKRPIHIDSISAK